MINKTTTYDSWGVAERRSVMHIFQPLKVIAKFFDKKFFDDSLCA